MPSADLSRRVEKVFGYPPHFVRVKACLLRSCRLEVRPKTLADAVPLHDVYGDREVMRFSGGAFASPAQTRQFVVRHIRHHEQHGFSMWSLSERATGEVIGDVGFLVFEQGVEIGWHLRRASWGQGFATEAARACLAYGFSELRFLRVSAFTETANIASLRVIQRLGMRLVREAAGDGVAPWREYVTTGLQPLRPQRQRLT